MNVLMGWDVMSEPADAYIIVCMAALVTNKPCEIPPYLVGSYPVAYS